MLPPARDAFQSFSAFFRLRVTGRRSPADDAGERRPVTRSRKKAENDWNASLAGGNDGFDWEAFQRYDDAAAWEKPRRGGGTRSVRRSGRPVTTGRQAAPKRIAAKGRKR